MDILRTMGQETNDTNVAFSPLSISTALAAVMIGSSGDSLLTLRHALYLWGMHPKQIHEAFHDLLLHLSANLQATVIEQSKTLLKQETDNELLFYSSMYVQRDYGISYPFQMYLLKFFNMTVHLVDFHRNGEEIKNHINAIIAKKTSGKILEILPNNLEITTSMLFLNGVYFQGLLDMDMTVIEDCSSGDVPPDMYFNNNGFNNDLVLLEARKVRVRYVEDNYLNCKAVEVPFKGSFLSMVVLLPNDPEGMSLLETRLSAQRLNDVMFNMEVKRINLQIPRIRLENTYQNLSHILRSMEITNIFNPGHANLSGMSKFRWLHVTDIIHKTYIEIKETESEAALATSADEDAFNMKLNKPFLYFIMDNISGLSIVISPVQECTGECGDFGDSIEPLQAGSYTGSADMGVEKAWGHAEPMDGLQ
ncbi:leukocyte elastase inhibitor-like [Limulus polyphemus]|uniref:Leukocyte elastase inhibitor-like n=1 Tax=Limulus polyphemus TaxID=6850 RepID=A0ABM1TJI9_LIMPO|nr:leukocyte elastase inhibitor-like [Limulus polyphemus]